MPKKVKKPKGKTVLIKDYVEVKPKDLGDLKRDRRSKDPAESAKGDPTTYARDIERDDKSEQASEQQALNDSFGGSLEFKFLPHNSPSELWSGSMYGTAHISLKKVRQAKHLLAFEESLNDTILELMEEKGFRMCKGEVLIKLNKRVLGALKNSDTLREALLLPRGIMLQANASRSFRGLLKNLIECVHSKDNLSIKELIHEFIDDSNKDKPIYIKMEFKDDRDFFQDEDTEKIRDQVDVYQKGNTATTDHNNYMDEYVGSPYLQIMQDAGRGSI